MPAKKENSNDYAAKLELYEKLVKTHPKAERKGDTIPYTSVNGNMYSALHKEGVLAIRLPQKEREEFMKKYKTGLMEAYGTVLKEYVRVPDSLLADTKNLKGYFAKSYEYGSSLKPKPTKKK